MRLMRKSFVRNQTLWTFAALAVSIFLCACNSRKNAVSGTIEVDEAHVGPRAGGRVEKILAWGGRHRARPEDLVRTATLLTALSIADALHRWVLPPQRKASALSLSAPRRLRQRAFSRSAKSPISQLLVSGGGARNPLILAQLSAALGGIEALTTESLGLPGDAKEAFIFALLADQTLHGRPSNLPSATGARRPALLGKICYPPPR